LAKKDRKDLTLIGPDYTHRDIGVYPPVGYVLKEIDDIFSETHPMIFHSLSVKDSDR
jgi:hypothetical protein